MQVSSGRTGRSKAQRKKLFRKADKCAVSEAPLAGSGLGAEVLEEAARRPVTEPASDTLVSLDPSGPLCFLSNQRTRDLELLPLLGIVYQL